MKKKKNVSTNNNEINIINENNKKEKKGYVITILIIAILFIISYTVLSLIRVDLNNIIEVIKILSFTLISIIIIIISFKLLDKKVNIYIIILSLILILYSILGISFGNKNEELYVTDFINKSYVEVLTWSEKNKIEIIELREYSDTVLKNHVIAQDAGINTLVKDINSLTITISDGPNYEKEVIIPSLFGFTYDEVMKFIDNNYLNNVNLEFIKSDEIKDTVIKQDGIGTLKRNSLINLTLSLGQDDITNIVVENLKNKSMFYAINYLKRNALEYEIKYEFSETVEINHVINQSVVDEVSSEPIVLTISKGKKIIVPDFNKMNDIEISKWAINNNIKIIYEEVYDKDKEAGKIINVSKKVNDVIANGDSLTIKISKGSMIMPKVDNLANFKLWANENNISFEEIYEFSDKYKALEVIKTVPEYNTKILDTDIIYIYISKGKSISVPNFVGTSKSSIQTKCNNLGLSCTFIYGGYTDNTNKDIAIKQSKNQGSVVASGSNITITLSEGLYKKVNVPSFIGKNKNDINKTCNNLGIICNFTYNKDYSNENIDTAISQDKTGTVIVGSKVNIVLSKGQAKTYTVVIDGSLLALGNPEQTKKTLKSKLESNCPGVNFIFKFEAVNSGIGYLNQKSDVKVGYNTLTQGKTYNVIINSN